MVDNSNESTGRDTRQRSSLVEKAAARLGRIGTATPLPAQAPASVAPSPATSPQSPTAPSPATPPPAAGTLSPLRAAAPAPAAGTPAPAAASRRTSRQVTIDVEGMRAAGMITVGAERSVIAEEFRLVKRPLLLKAFADGPDKIRNGNLIMLSSARPGEGKTFCAVNLAMSIALERDLTVMLIDADVAKPSVLNVLGFEAELGLTDLIADETLDLADVLVRTDIDRLTVLPAGRPHPLATELLASDRMERFVTDIAARYPDRIIILDSPPVLMSSIPGVLALHVGQIVFVVQAEMSTEASVDSALGLISACNNISLLLNQARDVAGSDRLGAYYGYYR